MGGRGRRRRPRHRPGVRRVRRAARPLLAGEGAAPPAAELTTFKPRGPAVARGPGAFAVVADTNVSRAIRGHCAPPSAGAAGTKATTPKSRLTAPFWKVRRK